jgi:hypothetical protein
MVFTTNALMNIPNINEDSGIKNAGVFNLICKKCDNILFADYENPSSYEKEPNGQIMSQIALKNAMRDISKAKLVFEIENAVRQRYDIPNNVTRWANETEANEINKVSLHGYQEEFSKAKKAVKKNWKDEYQLLYFEKLDYVIPIAFQDSVRPYCDFEGSILNEFTKLDAKVSEIHICIFPLNNCSVVFMFCYSDKVTKKYRNFRKQFLKLGRDDKLATICYLAFRYSEDVYLHKNIDPSVIENDSLIRIAGMLDACVFPQNTPRNKVISVMLESHALSQSKNIPNLLLPKYAIKD